MNVIELQAQGAIRLVGTETTKVRLLRSHPVEEFYPAEARRKGLDGIVTVDLFINELAALDVAKTYEFENTLKKLVLMAMTIQFQP